MDADPEMVSILCAGLLSQGFVETACGYGQGFHRFGKFGRAGMTGEAYYVQPDGSLWFSALHFTEPDHRVTGPILDRIFEAGCEAAEDVKALIARRKVDADKALDELIGGSDET